MNNFAIIKQSRAVRHLREAAVRELNSTTTQVLKPSDMSFDQTHEKTPEPTIQSQEDFDRDNGVAQYPGPNIPHIGNGSGGIR